MRVNHPEYYMIQRVTHILYMLFIIIHHTRHI